MKIGHGAEAEVFREGEVVIKKRIKKNYRHPDIDNLIRKERNKKESRIMGKVLGIKVPKVLAVSDFEFSMENIGGKTLRSYSSLKGLSRKIGEVVGTLHKQGIYHGDLTTSNMILSKDEIVLIDFGLAGRGKIEDFATDLKVLFEVAQASHIDFSRAEFFKGYSKTMEKSKEVKTRLEKVYSRGRYLKGQLKGSQ